MNITFIKNLARNNPALARALEVGLYTVFGYVLGAIIAGDPLSWHAILVSLITPLSAYVGKKRRDLEK